MPLSTLEKVKVKLTDHPNGTKILRFLGSGTLSRVPPESGVVQKLPDPAPNAANQPLTVVEPRYVLACANSLTTSNSGVQREAVRYQVRTFSPFAWEPRIRDRGAPLVCNEPVRCRRTRHSLPLKTRNPDPCRNLSDYR